MRFWNCLVLSGVVVSCGSGKIELAADEPDRDRPLLIVDDDAGLINSPHLGTPQVDRRPVVSAGRPVAPISGGSLLFSEDGQRLVASDPGRDKLWLVDVATGTVLRTIELPQGAQPFRLAIDPSGRFHATLRGSGEILSFDDQDQLVHRAACSVPLGIAYSNRLQSLLIACRDGRLLGMPASEGPAKTLAQLPLDLRDVLVVPQSEHHPERLYVTRFKTAQVLELDFEHDLHVKTTNTLPNSLGVEIAPLPPQPNADSDEVVRGEREDQDAAVPPSPGEDMPVESQEPSTAGPDALPADEARRVFTPSVAWSAVATAAGPVVVHQRGTETTIEAQRQNSPYGGSGFCGGGLVSSGISSVTANGDVTTLGVLANVVLPVSVSVSSDSRYVAVAEAGQRDPNAPLRFIAPEEPIIMDDVGSVSAWIYERASLTIPNDPELGVDRCEPAIHTVTAPASQTRPQAIAVAFSPTQADQLATLLRQPATLLLTTLDAHDTPTREIVLEDSSILDTGHDLFHQATSANISCANCHPEGGEDGRTWRFSDVGVRRTQALNIGLEGTAPFHWNGEFADISELMKEVLGRRMGAAQQSTQRAAALRDWLFSLEPTQPSIHPDSELVSKGAELFTSHGCATCHTHSGMTKSYDVGTSEGAPLQAPSLRSIAYRAPFMHDGCAESLEARFEPECGGDNHGDTANLSQVDREALVAYLKTL